MLVSHVFTCSRDLCSFSFFFFNDTATTEIYTLSLHDALPISRLRWDRSRRSGRSVPRELPARESGPSRASSPGSTDRKSTRLNSSHGYISYAVFCLKKKKKNKLIWPRLQSNHCSNIVRTTSIS